MATADSLGRRQRNRLRMLDRIAVTAARLFELHGYEAVTMEQIAAEADVAKRTLYNHFAVKEAVLAYWIHTRLKADLLHLQKAIARRTTFLSRMSYLLNASADWCRAHPTYLAPYLRHRFQSMESVSPSEGVGAGGDIAPAFQALIAAAQQSGELRRDLAAPQLAAFFHHLYLGALMRWLTVPGLVLHEEFAAAINLFVAGAAKRRVLRNIGE